MGAMDTTHAAAEPMSVGRVSSRFGITVRTLHHYDEVGLLRPSERTSSGYRLYTARDLTRLAHIVTYRRLGFSLEQIADLLDADPDGVASHLRRQREVVSSRLDDLHALITALDHALETTMTDQPLSAAELKELFGDGYGEDYAAEAEQRWGETDAWKQSRSRTSRYTRADWEAVKAEAEAVNVAFVAALEAGLPATSVEAMDAAEAHRRQIHDRFYDLGYDMHRGLADMYLADPRFTKTYEDVHAGLAQYVRDAIHANADRHTP